MPAGVLRRIRVSGASRIEWWHAFPATVLAVLIAALVTGALFGPIGMLLCGMLSVFLYRQRDKTARITRWIGARLGAISGALGVGIIAIFRSKLKISELASQAMQTAIERNSDPVSRKSLQDLVTQHPHVLITALIICMVVLFLVISSLGGVIGAALINRWRPETKLISADNEAKLEQREKTERSDHD